MGLNIDAIRTKQLLGTPDCDIFNNINILAAAVIALARIALCIFVGQHAAHSGHHSGGNKVFRGDQLNVALLAAKFLLHRLANLRIKAGNKADGIENLIVHNA